MSVAQQRFVQLIRFLITFFHVSARSWATAAGREDLMEKKMSSVVKYFLCSEHFTSGCFDDPPYNTRLKKTVRPEVSVPIPSIFENNIDKYIPKNVQLNVDILSRNDEISFDSNGLDECYNCEVPSDVHFLDSELPDINHSGIAINAHTNEPTFIDIDAYDTLSDSYDFIIEDNVDLDESNLKTIPECDTQPMKIIFMCRLCALIFLTDAELSQISNITGLEAKLNLLLPNLVNKL